MRKGRVRKPSFTLVELLIVVIILGILAAAVIPLFADAMSDAKLSATAESLAIVRKQLELYKHEHMDSYPPLKKFKKKLTKKTNPDGSTNGTPTLGPYLERIPNNPFTTGSKLNKVTSKPSGPKKAWWYDETTGEFRANDGGSTNGVLHASL